MKEAHPKSNAAPGIVYHYTSLDALLKITTGKKLWATNIRYLNDVSEFHCFIQAAQNRLPHVIPKLANFDINNHLNSASQRPVASPQFVHYPFVTSFSFQDDSLMHWRSYCPANNGVSIGFRTESLRASYVNCTPQIGVLVPEVTFGPVYYLEPENHVLIDEAIRNAYKAAESSSLPAREHTLLDRLVYELASYACFVKDQSFRNEHEFRLVVGSVAWRQDLLCFRANKSTLVPYVEINLSDRDSASQASEKKSPPLNEIASITIGPTANMSLSYESLYSFCSTRGIEATIKESNVPYRDWQ